MTKKISKTIIMVTSVTLLCTLLLIVGSLYNYFTNIQKENQKNDIDLIATAVSHIGLEYLESLQDDKHRITWIDADGTVLFDSIADKKTMENHGDREEFLEAVKYGEGEGKRVSKTLSEETIYRAKLLSDNTVIRLSFTQLTVISLLYNMIWILVMILALSVIVSVVLASKTAKKIVEPINKLNLDNPLQNDVYEELTPLLHRIDKQNDKIKVQIKSLKEQKNEVEFITENVADGIVILNEKGIILSCNKVSKNLLDCKEEEYYLNSFRNVDYEKIIEDALKGISGKCKIKKGDDVYLFSASPTYNINDEFSIFLFINNVTDEENILNIRRQFSANVSHELKTPLTSIMGASELLANNIVKKEDIPIFAKNIYTEADRLLKLVQDIIKISMLDEQSKFEFENVNLENITKDVISYFDEKIKEKEIVVKVNTIPANIKAVPTVIYEMIYNLCDNAINYNKQAGEIFIDIIKVDDKFQWSIKDTGMGISNEHLPRIFERFYRVDKSHSKETGGTGLGLSIVKNGANLHGAKLEIESKVDVGTTISLLF